MQNCYDASIEIQTGSNPLFSVIWLHGLGAEASDFRSIVPTLRLKHSPPTRFIFPNAPHIPVTMNNGYVSRAWYDIISAEKNRRVIDESSLLSSRERIRQVIATENQRGIPTQRIFLAGFSQGGALAYFTALTHPERLAGVIALSTYLPSTERVITEANTSEQDMPIFAAHGTNDDVVTPEFGYQAITTLQEFGFSPEWRTFPIGHELSVSEIREIGRWLRAQLENKQ